MRLSPIKNKNMKPWSTPKIIFRCDGTEGWVSRDPEASREAFLGNWLVDESPGSECLNWVGCKNKDSTRKVQVGETFIPGWGKGEISGRRSEEDGGKDILGEGDFVWMLRVCPGALVQACPSSLVLLRPSFLCPAAYPHWVSQLWSSQVLSPSFPLTLSLCICVLHSPVSAYRETMDAIGFENPEMGRVWQLVLMDGTEYIVNMGFLLWNLELDGSWLYCSATSSCLWQNKVGRSSLFKCLFLGRQR